MSAFRVGQVVHFLGRGLDAEASGGVLPASAFHWHLDLLHNGHVHPNTYVVNGTSTGSFRVPRHDEPGKFSLRLTLTVEDSVGQTGSDTVIIHTGLSAARRGRRRG